MSHQLLCPPQAIRQDDAHPRQIQQPDQPQCSERTQHGKGDHCQVEQVMRDPSPACRGQPQLDEVLDHERCPYREVDCKKGVIHARRQADEQRDDQNRQPYQCQDRQWEFYDGREAVVGVLGSTRHSEDSFP
jgi:hypothetical protein